MRRSYGLPHESGMRVSITSAMNVYEGVAPDAQAHEISGSALMVLMVTRVPRSIVPYGS